MKPKSSFWTGALLSAFAWGALPAAVGASSELPAPTAASVAADLDEPALSQPFLLAYISEVDLRPLYLEDALLLVKLPNGEWGLRSAYRHPREARPRWILAMVYDGNVKPSRDFSHRPTRQDVENFLVDSHWLFRPHQDFHTLQAQVFEQAWMHGLGFSSQHKFSEPKIDK